MNRYTFTCAGQTHIIVAKSLAGAVTELPANVKTAYAELSVRIEPVEDEKAYLKARVAELENRLQEVLRQ